MRATEQVALSVLEDQGDIDDLPGAQDEEPQVLWPGTDYKDGTLYMTFPRFREVEIRDKKGNVVGTELVVSTFALTSERTAFWYDEENVLRKGYVFPQTFTQEQESRWPIPDIDSFRKGQAPVVDPAGLFTELTGTIFDHVEYDRQDSPFYDLVAYYLMLTYVFRIFGSISYLHFNGTMASGKSQNLRLFSLLGFNAVWASNMSPASLYRQVAGCPGVLCIDEAESFDGERGEELRRLLNAGYTSPGLVPRAEKTGERFSVIKYATYGPKVLASINPLEPVIGSRCIVIPMQPSLREIKPIRPDDGKWARMRNELYLWAMQNAYDIDERKVAWQARIYDMNTTLKDRQWELALPFVVLADHVGGEDEAKRIIAFFEQQFEAYRKAQEDTDRLRLLLKCLPAVLMQKDPIGDDWYYVKDIHDIVAEHIDEDAREYYRTKSTGKHLNALGWRERKTHKGGPLVRITEDSVREQFRKRNVDPFTAEETNYARDDVKWLAGEASYLNHTRSPESEPEPTLWTGVEPDDGDQ